LPLIEENLVSYGFPHLRIDPEVDKEQADKKLQEFEVRKQEQAQAMQEQAAASLAQYESKKKEQKESAAHFDGPIQMGRNIPADEPITPMGNIIEEERRITIEGFIFDKEVRELRS
ncbi:hypothetical protein KQJ29_27845, partial [Enterococcus sp. S181_ASV_20]|nr:hypothetical protein [Enterococcus sp. S181_ASV_20]